MYTKRNKYEFHGLWVVCCLYLNLYYYWGRNGIEFYAVPTDVYKHCNTDCLK